MIMSVTACEASSAFNSNISLVAFSSQQGEIEASHGEVSTCTIETALVSAEPYATVGISRQLNWIMFSSSEPMDPSNTMFWVIIYCGLM